MPFRRLSLLSWLLAGVLLLSLGLNVFFLAPHYRTPDLVQELFSVDDDDWDDDDDDDNDESFGQSRAALADELRRTRQQLTQCQAGTAVRQVPRRSGAAVRVVFLPPISPSVGPPGHVSPNHYAHVHHPKTAVSAGLPAARLR